MNPVKPPNAQPQQQQQGIYAAYADWTVEQLQSEARARNLHPQDFQSRVIEENL